MAPIEAVISGIGGAFPSSHGIEEFIENLFEGRNLSSVDDIRWEPGLLGTSPHVGKIQNVSSFDNSLFKVHKPLARLMDPLARLLLERSMEAIVDAGLSPKALEKTYTSVFMTTTVSESESRTTSILTNKKAGGYAIMAGSKTMMSNRISYFLNLNGPSITLDGDWTVALLALQRAARSIESGESDYALVGAANTCLFPELNKIYENFGVLSTDGQCRPLDASASGCFRSEGAIVFLLQRSDRANRVYARVGGVNERNVGTRSRFVGIDTRLLPPLMEELYRSTGVDPKSVRLLATDGISIPEIERDELEASASVLCKNRTSLPVSSAKSVAGHGDASGALVSLIHTISAMERGVIPPLKHFVKPHPGARSVIDGRLKVVSTPEAITFDEDSAVAVNTLGFSGCIAHTVLKPFNKVKQPISEENKDYPRLVIVSGRTEEDAVKVANKIIDQPFDPEYICLTQRAFSEPITGYRCRATTIIPTDVPGMRPLVASKEADAGNRPVWFVYSGMGSQWAGMGKGLLRLPEFAETIKRLQPVLEPEGIDLLHTITTDDSELFENIIYSFISIAAIQIGLTNVMRSLGIEPSGIIGHSTGELGCAYGDGCLSEEETLRAAYGRGKASLAAELIRGMMASIGMSWQDAQDAIPPSIDVACHNSSDNCTISGPTDDVLKFVDELKEKNIFARTVNVSNIAFHSRYVKPAGEILREYLNAIITNPKRRSERWVASSLNPGDEKKISSYFAGPEFFTNNLLSPVRFEEAMKSVPPGAVVVELAPHGLMQPLIRRELPEGSVTFSLTRRGHKDGLRFLLENVGKLFMEGLPVKPWVLAPSISLPVSRGTASLTSLVTWDHREEWPLIISTKSEVTRPVNVPMHTEATPCITQRGKRCIAPSVFLEIVWKELAAGKTFTECPVIFQDLEFTSPVEMVHGEQMAVDLVLQRITGHFEVSTASDDFESCECILKGKVFKPDPTEMLGMMSAHPKVEQGVSLEKEDVYAELLDHDLKYDGALQTLRRVTFNATETYGLCCWSGKWNLLIDSLFQLSALTSSDASIFCGKIRKITIAPQEMRSNSNALQVRHHLSTSVLAAPGINIEGYRRTKISSTSSVSVLNLSVKPLQQQGSLDTHDFLREVAMLRVLNSNAQDSSFSVLVLEKERDDIATALQQVIRAAVGEQVPVRKVAVEAADKIPTDVTGAAIVVTDFSSMQVDRVLAHLGGANAMILRWGVRGGHNRYVTLASNLSAGGSLTLLVKPREVVDMRVVHVLADECVPKNVQVPPGGEVILVWRGVPHEGVYGAVASVRSMPYGSKTRIIIIMDTDAPEFSLQESIFADRLSLGMTVNILQDGMWNELRLSRFNHLPSTPYRVEGFEATVLGLNPSDLAQESEPRLGAYDFCGLQDGKRYVGLARLGAASIAFPDEILRWTVPEHWTDQQAVTVPTAYSVAFHVLDLLANVKVGEHVLIMNGTSPVSQACIRVATKRGCHVMTTVTSEIQRKEVLALNPQVNPERVFRSDKNTFKYFLRKATGGRGLDVSLVPNCDSVINVVLQCNGLNGRVFVMSKRNALAHHVGMFPFKDSAEMFAGGVDALLSTSLRDKKAVQEAVRAGIASGEVQPLPHHVVEHVENLDLTALQGSVKQVLRLRDTVVSRASARSKAGVSFAIVGGGSNSLVAMARAASAHGSTIVLASNRECGTPARARFVPALRQTVFVPFPKAQGDAKQFLSVASKAGDIKAIVVNVEDAADRSLTVLLKSALPTVNGALRGVRLLVVTDSLNLGTETVESWRRIGLPACAVVGDPRQAAQVLPNLLTVGTLPEVVLTFQDGTDCRLALGALTSRPARSTELVHHHRDRTGAKVLVEVPSLAPRLRWRHHRLEPLPLVTVTGPSLSASGVKEVAASLMSPIVMADSSQLTAETLTQEILRLQPRGPWAVYGDEGCAPLLLRAAALVEKQSGRPDWNEVVHLALLEDREAQEADVHADHAGTLHIIRRYDGAVAKAVAVNERKMRHYAANPRHVATILNDYLLSPLCKIISC